MSQNSHLKRVVVTGMGIVSCIGNNVDEVLVSLKEGKSGISFAPEYEEMGFRSQIYGKPNIDLAEQIDFYKSTYYSSRYC
jgi:3-oxoacyl-[acyl-carrier-protein] synthase-1